MTYHKLRICCAGAMLVGAPLACMDLDGYRLKTEVAARGGSPPTGSGGTAGAPRGGSAGTCANEVFTLYNEATDYDASSASCTSGYPMYAAVYVLDPADYVWLLSGETTTESVAFGGQMDLQVQCCWLDFLGCSELTTTCDVYGISYKCSCNVLMTFQLTSDTCPGEIVHLCS
jgi:hypothetical protein